MDDLDKVRLDLDKMKLDLEVEKFKFEKGQIRRDHERRREELEKLRVDRRKAQLEAQDLEIRYRNRPTYRTATFQGIALVKKVEADALSGKNQALEAMKSALAKRQLR